MYKNRNRVHVSIRALRPNALPTKRFDRLSLTGSRCNHLKRGNGEIRPATLVGMTAAEFAELVESAVKAGHAVNGVQMEHINDAPARIPNQGHQAIGDFIAAYGRYADVFEMPRQLHEAIAIAMVAGAANSKV